MFEDGKRSPETVRKSANPRLNIVYIIKLFYVSDIMKFGPIHLIRVAFVAFLLFAGASSAGQAAELVMFRQGFCEWCEVWDDEVGVVYGKTREGRWAPLREVDIHDKRPSDLTGIRPVIFTPTFVLMENGSEVGRIQGYPGEDFFWGLLDKMLKKRLTGS